MSKNSTHFSSRLGFIFSMMGIAVGAGNIWRFPRIAAQNGNGAFILIWLLFLFIWSIPLIIIELSLGKLTKKAPIGTLIKTAGPKYAWLGGFITLVTTCILAYYSNIVGWGLSYFYYSISGKIYAGNDFSQLWETHYQSLSPLFFHFLSLFLAYMIIRKGIVQGIEKCNKILIPSFFVCTLVLLLRAITLPNAMQGIKQLFTLDFTSLSSYKLWLEALTQNAWDTGAGWGLLLVYSGFASKKTGVVSNGALTAISNNLVSLIMGVIVFATCASLDTLGTTQLQQGAGSSSIGIAFIYLPELFTRVPGSAYLPTIFSSIFFLAFAMAALSSMISMLFLFSQTLSEFGVKKHIAELSATIIAFILGVPSSLSLAVFANQDTVWGIGLILNGLIFIYAAIHYGLPHLKKKIINAVPGDIHLNTSFDYIIKYLLPIEGTALLCWYFYEGLFPEDGDWWNPISVYSLSSLVLQWSIGLVILWSLNKKLSKCFSLYNLDN
ncbi:sodium-dependent transporter [Chlamydia abortus]|uniref:Sodium symporter-family membrane transport protein n=1 Tax=Chlamydia abortus (strain DSM 27085 / S26/3) TaxID=218497 RepID=Q5L600_CHLAB|nr:sodium-dependent transporter [Chlamydia abortus]ASD30641.1 sodium-dependent transporter [Chlamydia abortus]AUS59945.1 SNF family Na(+)-dependent transporter [Chlamydia abortus]EGK69243.1 sodium symporter-family membrane transport protein [Chlamydia abortus LLG]QRR32167.1 sodium-dependent transporter [Chlamydia abortus]CAH63931.1 putative sodium symporter-family membrane transport protein [Chlamydia abortus S26/3]